jgi:hypothetical protein
VVENPDNSARKTGTWETIKCPNCGNLHPVSNQFCPQCGVRLGSLGMPPPVPAGSSQRQIDQVLEAVDRERPFAVLRVVGSIFGALGWITLGAMAIALLSAIVTLILAKPLPIAGTQLVEGFLIGIAVALPMLGTGDFVDWLVDADRHARETNLLLEALLRGRAD